MPKDKKVVTPQRKSMFARGEVGRRMDEKWEEERQSQKNSSRPYSLKPGKKGIIVLLDDAELFYKAHTGKKGKDQFYTKPCLEQAIDEHGNPSACPYCDEETRFVSIYVAGTAIDCTGFINDDDKKIAFFKRLFALKSDAKNEFQEQRKALIKKYGKEEPLRLTMWEVRRGKNPKSLGSGEHFTFKGKFKSKKALKEWLEKRDVERDDWKEYLTPFDYEEVLKPETEEQARRFLGQPSSGGKGPVRRNADDLDDDDDSDKSIEDEYGLD